MKRDEFSGRIADGADHAGKSPFDRAVSRAVGLVRNKPQIRENAFTGRGTDPPAFKVIHKRLLKRIFRVVGLRVVPAGSYRRLTPGCFFAGLALSLTPFSVTGQSFHRPQGLGDGSAADCERTHTELADGCIVTGTNTGFRSSPLQVRAPHALL